MRRRTGRLAALTLGACLAALPVAAQGKGNAFGHMKKGGGPAAATASELQLPGGAGVRNFGSWLDDASIMPEGAGALTLSLGYWRTPAFSEWDVPVADASVALTRRVQLGASMPYFHASEHGGPVARGFGDLYLSAKVQLREPSERRALGFSVTPLLEVASSAPSADQGRVSWAIPANVELQRRSWRAFGSAGYFSRGSLFASGAIEVPLNARTHITGTLSRSHSVKRDDLSTALGYAQTRTDVTGGLSAAVSDTVTLFGAVGRTISARDPNSAVVVVSGGAAFTFSAWRPATPRSPK